MQAAKMYTGLVSSIVLACYCSGILTENTDLKYNVSIQLCGHRCYISGSCTDIKLNTGNLQSQLTINKHMKRSNTPLMQLHPVVWMYVPELQCVLNGRLVSVTTKEPRCVADQLRLTHSSTTALSPVYSRITALSLVYTGTTTLSRVYSGITTLSRVYSSAKALSAVHTTTSSSPKKETEVKTSKCSGNVKFNTNGSKSSSYHCRAGMPFDPKRNKCVKVCGSYGRTMTMYRGFALNGNNVSKFSGVTSEECKMKCVSSKKFVCKSFEYGKGADFSFIPFICNLSKKGYFEVKPSERIRKKNWTLGVRNCQEEEEYV